jgi:hypothetical protein
VLNKSTKSCALIQDTASYFSELRQSGGCRDVLGQLGAMPQSITVTPEEREAIDRVKSLLFICSYL